MVKVCCAGRCEVTDNNDLECVGQRGEGQLGEDGACDSSAGVRVARERDHALRLEVEVELATVFGLTERHQQWCGTDLVRVGGRS